MIVNVEALVVAALRAANVCGGRVHVDLPASITYPAARVVRLGGPQSSPIWIDSALLQIDLWGSAGPSGTDEAFDAAEMTVAVLAQLAGATTFGVVSNVTINGIANAYDESFKPARARRIITVTVATHPNPTQ